MGEAGQEQGEMLWDGVISKSLKTKFREVYDQVGSRFCLWMIQLITEQCAKAKGAALMLFVFGGALSSILPICMGLLLLLCSGHCTLAQFFSLKACFLWVLLLYSPIVFHVKTQFCTCRIDVQSIFLQLVCVWLPH